jgi:hypothetical protein
MVQIAAKKDIKIKKIPTVQEIKDLIVSLGGKEITDEDRQTDWYKFISKKPDCFNKS